jgi:hypothetical protein
MIKTFLLDPDLIDKSQFNEEFYSSTFLRFLSNIHPNTRKRGFIPVLDAEELFIKKLINLAKELDYEIHPEYQTEIKEIITKFAEDYIVGGNTHIKSFLKLNNLSIKESPTEFFTNVDKYKYIDCFISNDKDKLEKIKKAEHLKKYDFNSKGPFQKLNVYKNSGFDLATETQKNEPSDIFGKIILDSKLITFEFFNFFEAIIKFYDDGSVVYRKPYGIQKKQINHFKGFLRILIDFKNNHENDIFENSDHKPINIDIIDIPVKNCIDKKDNSKKELELMPKINEVSAYLSEFILSDSKIRDFHDTFGININIFINYRSKPDNQTKTRRDAHMRKMITEYERIRLNFNLDILDNASVPIFDKIGKREKFGYSETDEKEISELFETKKSEETLKILNILETS